LCVGRGETGVSSEDERSLGLAIVE
jgi:hypothetical protein